MRLTILRKKCIVENVYENYEWRELNDIKSNTSKHN